MVRLTNSDTNIDAKYKYDALGRRIERTVDDSDNIETTRYFYRNWQVLEEQDGGKATTATYVYGLYIDEVLNMKRGSENTYYHTDDIYSVGALTDTSGAVVERYEYDDFGEPTFIDSSGNPFLLSLASNPYLFTGRRFDQETGLYYYRTRYLDSTAGRFTSRDIVGIWSDVNNLGNPFSFSGNNPISRLDPLGTKSDDVCCEPSQKKVKRLNVDKFNKCMAEKMSLISCGSCTAGLIYACYTGVLWACGVCNACSLVTLACYMTSLEIVTVWTPCNFQIELPENWRY